VLCFHECLVCVVALLLEACSIIPSLCVGFSYRWVLAHVFFFFLLFLCAACQVSTPCACTPRASIQGRQVGNLFASGRPDVCEVAHRQQADTRGSYSVVMCCVGSVFFVVTCRQLLQPMVVVLEGERDSRCSHETTMLGSVAVCLSNSFDELEGPPFGRTVRSVVGEACQQSRLPHMRADMFLCCCVFALPACPLPPVVTQVLDLAADWKNKNIFQMLLECVCSLL